MSFPVWIPIGPWRLHPHLVFELAAYAGGFRLYLARRRRLGDALDDPHRWWIVAAAALGAALGARLLYLFECPAETWRHIDDPAFLLGGKTIVGGLAGGWLAVELAKRALGVESRTGDLFALPLAVAIAIGRIGCFLSGPGDHTFGTATSLPWGVDFGDGVRRHPAALYEAIFLAALAVVLWRLERRSVAGGDLFRLFVVSYFGYRLVADLWKPVGCRFAGLTAIQWTAALAVATLLPDMLRWSRDGLRRGAT